MIIIGAVIVGLLVGVCVYQDEKKLMAREEWTKTMCAERERALRDILGE